MTRGIVVGVDGGGTKTDVCVATSTGEVIAFVSGGGANWEGAGLEAVGDVLYRLLATALGDCGVSRTEIAASAFCMAGVDWPSDVGRLAPHLDALGVGGPRVLTNDSFAALRAGTSGMAGCVSIAGTGGVAAGRNTHGETARTMGVGIGEGSGAWGLVAGALAAIAAEHHASGEPTALTPVMLEALGAESVPDLFEGLTRGTFFVGGELSVHVLAAATAGDPVAIGISADCGALHGRDTAGVATRLGMAADSFDVVLAGGVHLNGEASFRSSFTGTVHSVCPRAVLKVLDAPPVAGAVLLALELIDVDATLLHNAVTAATIAARTETMIEATS